MVHYFSLLAVLALSWFSSQTAGLSIGGKPNQLIQPYKREALQNLVGHARNKVSMT